MKNLITLLLISCSLNLTGQELSLEKILSYSFPSGLTSSKNSAKIAWIANKEGVRNVYYAEGPDYSPIQLTKYTKDDGQAIGSLVFSTDDSKLFYVRGGGTNRRGEYPNPTSNPDGADREIYEIALENKSIKKIASGSSPLPYPKGILYSSGGKIMNLENGSEEASQLFKARGGINSLRLSPDGKKIAFVSSRDRHSFIGIYNLSTGALNYYDPTLHIDNNPVWSPDSRRVAFLRFTYEPPEIFVAQRSAAPYSIQIITMGRQGSKNVWTADKGTGSAFRSISGSNQLYWLKSGHLVFPWEKAGYTQLWAVSEAGGKTENLTPGQYEVQFVSQSPDMNSMLYSGNEGDTDRQHAWMVKPGSTRTALTSGNGVEWEPVMDGSGTASHLGSTGTSPASVYAIKNNSSKMVFGTEDYPSDQLNDPKQVVFSSADGMKIHGQLFLPPKMKKGEKYPALLFFHGGSRRQMLLGFHHRGYYHNSFAMNQYMASKGYIVLSVNYRSGIGYGMEFREALNYGAGGASEFNDVMGAGLFMQNHPNVDPEKIGLWGGSYGGYLTAMGLAKASHLFKAGVDVHGVTDWNVVIKNFVPSYNPLEDPDFTKLAYESSPIAHMSTWKSPVLLIHGDDDRNVPFSETVDKAAALMKYGVEFEQLIFPDEVHGFLLHKNWMAAYKATEDFFNRKLK